VRALLVLLMLVLPLTACVSTGTFGPEQLFKSDVDRVADIHRREAFAGLRLLAEKLYRRNPREWRKGGQASMDAALARLFDPATAWRLPEPGGRGGEAILLALREDWAGDRVAAFVVGLGGMMHGAFNGKTEFFLLDELDPQSLYNSARNVEIAAWKLTHARSADGTPLLLSNEMTPVQNLSFEREFGKLVGNLDLLSVIVAERTNRTIAKAIQSVATAVFLPIAGF